MTILALDQATKCGWCLVDDSGGITSGVLDLSDMSHPVAMYRFRSWLAKMLRDNKVGFLAIEEQFSGATKNIRTERWLNYLRMAPLEVCAAMEIAKGQKIQTLVISPQTWRPWFLNCAKAPKEIAKAKRRAWWKKQAVEKCRSLGHDIKRDDEAEAIGIGLYVHECVKNGLAQEMAEAA